MSDVTELCARMDFIHAGRATRRYHTLDMIDYQRIDAHSYGVAMFTTIVVPIATPERRARLLMAGLVHDLAEHKVGDIPSPAKRELGIRDQLGDHEDALLHGAGLAVPSLNVEDARVLNIADCADGIAHCIAERAKGNIGVREAVYNFWDYLNKELELWHPMINKVATEDGEPALRRWLARKWEEANGGVW